ncbi:hypothetical protein MITS9509_00982 [Synechococcus sp. MIT S9509]|uniref:hypothetical protein n=1 Tax=Synechococcus sp. MIT S9509 TaxID=1801630 RepID=UPI0007BAED4E|nr:hypothetical protein [Synechococcus sp. MIT S9509]KZR93105.1 hypothetical protein MITS9509_00982 [Synechococcus sp. MIT S9509]
MQKKYYIKIKYCVKCIMIYSLIAALFVGISLSIASSKASSIEFSDCFFNEKKIPCTHKSSGDMYGGKGVLRIQWKDGKINTYRSVPFRKSDNPSTGIPWRSGNEPTKLVKLKFGTVWTSKFIVEDEQGGRWQLACTAGQPYRGADSLYNPRNGNVIRYNISECVPHG